jgi:hypothetical protein
VQPSPPDSDVSIEAEAAPSEAQESERSVNPEECSLEIQGLIAESIESQTSAFADEDFETAYSFASPSFRSDVNIQSFVAIIAGSYGPLILSTELAFSNCAVVKTGHLASLKSGSLKMAVNSMHFAT